MNLGEKKQANIYVTKHLHELFVKIAKHTPFSVGDIYVMATARVLGHLPDPSDPNLNYQNLGSELFQKLNGGSALGAVISEEVSESEKAPEKKIKKPALSPEIKERKNVGQRVEKTHRDDQQYLWMLQNEMEVWKPCFDKFTHLARVTAIQSPTDDDLNSVVDEQENLYVITFMGYSNPKKGSHGVFDGEPLLSTNVGFFITTLICGDPEGKKVYAGRSMPRKLFNQLSETDLEKQAISTPEIMFTRPNTLSEEEMPFWGYCDGALSQLETIFENNADFAYLEQQFDELPESMEEKSFMEILSLIFADHYGYWQYYLDNYEIKTSAQNYNPQGAEE